MIADPSTIKHRLGYSSAHGKGTRASCYCGWNGPWRNPDDDHIEADSCPYDVPTAAACGHTVTDRHDLHWSADLEDEVCPDCCQECDQ